MRTVTESIVEDAALAWLQADGSIAGAQARVIDFDAPATNDWLAVNRFTVSEGQHVNQAVVSDGVQPWKVR